MVNAPHDPGRADLGRIRFIHFLWAGSVGMMMPFLGLFYQRHGLSGAQIGWLSAISAGVALVVAPVWGRWNDTVSQPRRLLQISMAGTALCMLWLSQQTMFAWMAIILGLSAVLSAASEPMAYTLTLSITDGLKNSGFGSVRLWGSVGWAVAAPVSGWIIERTSVQSIFFGMAFLSGVSIIALNTLALAWPGRNVTSTAPRPALRQVVGALLGSRLMLGLGLALTISWLTGAGRYQFEAIYLDQLGASEGWIGVVNTTGALIELPAMLLADRLVRRYGAARVFQVSFLLEAIATLIVVAGPSVASIFVMRLVAGIAYSFNIITLTVYVTDNAPARQSATALALFTVTLHSLVSLVSGPLNGLVFDALGAYWLYVMALGGSLLTWLTLQITNPQPLNPFRVPKEESHV